MYVTIQIGKKQVRYELEAPTDAERLWASFESQIKLHNAMAKLRQVASS